jgi:transcriptional regulator GlxA family with amidase domain
VSKFGGLDVEGFAWHRLAEMPIRPQFPPSPRKIEILAFPDVQLLDVTGPLQVFASANRQAQEAGQPLPYALTVVAATPGPICSSAGLAFLTAPLPPVDQALDSLIIAGGMGVAAEMADGMLVDWITRRALVARRIASVCTGAFLLAATGLLDGRRATTHWSRCADLAEAFPAVRVEQDPIFINDGMFWTSAGVTAGIDAPPPPKSRVIWWCSRSDRGARRSSAPG